ncbi:hypothetical protein [Streptomyces erythrochromogenes]|uniref:hypothetical protein n=1 Tax=Streptomyces erythrochromogenes TaxID=285574 RepID=UPI003434D9D1
MRKHRKQTDTTAPDTTTPDTTTPDGADRGRLAQTGRTGRGTPRAEGWLSFCVGRAMNTPPASADRARAQRIGMAVATASIGR